MHIIRDPADFPTLANAVVTSGTFDGVHRGHQRILARLRQVADAVGGPAVVITYWPHPRLVLGPPPSHSELLELQLLNTLEERVAQLADYGVHMSEPEIVLPSSAPPSSACCSSHSALQISEP